MRATRKSTEKETQKAVLDYLKAKNIFHWRNNTGAMKTASGGFIRFGAIGSPDIFALAKGRAYGFEIKDEKGKQSPEQEMFALSMTKAGGCYAVIRNVDEVMAIL